MFDAALLLEKLEQMVEGLKMVGKFLKTAELVLDGEDYYAGVSRCYYTMFFVAEASLIGKKLNLR